MAVGYTFRCRECGNSVEIILGMYYACGWGNPRVREDIMNGKYGQEAIDALAGHEDALFYIESCAYQCKGHFIGSVDTLFIQSNNLKEPEMYYRFEPECPKCKKKMKEWKRGKAVCPKCKGIMEEDLSGQMMID